MVTCLLFTQTEFQEETQGTMKAFEVPKHSVGFLVGIFLSLLLVAKATLYIG